MPTFSYGNDGEIIMYSKYTRSGVLTLHNIFPDDSTTGSLVQRKKDTPGIATTYGVTHKADLVIDIFVDCLKIVLRKVTEGDLFMLPGTTGAHIVLKKTPDKEVRLLRQLGKYDNIDIVKAKFNIPRYTFDFGYKSTRRDRQIAVPEELRQQAFRNVENGVIKWITLRKRLDDDI